MVEGGVDVVYHCSGLADLLFNGYLWAVERVYSVLGDALGGVVTVVVAGVYCRVEGSDYVVGRVRGVSASRIWVPGGGEGDLFVASVDEARRVLGGLVSYIVGDEKLAGKAVSAIVKGKDKRIYRRGSKSYVFLDGYGYTGLSEDAVPLEIMYDGRAVVFRRPHRFAEYVASQLQPVEKYIGDLRKLLGRRVGEDAWHRLVPHVLVREYIASARAEHRITYPEHKGYIEVLEEYLGG